MDIMNKVNLSNNLYKIKTFNKLHKCKEIIENSEHIFQVVDDTKANANKLNEEEKLLNNIIQNKFYVDTNNYEEDKVFGSQLKQNSTKKNYSKKADYYYQDMINSKNYIHLFENSNMIKKIEKNQNLVSLLGKCKNRSYNENDALIFVKMFNLLSKKSNKFKKSSSIEKYTKKDKKQSVDKYDSDSSFRLNTYTNKSKSSSFEKRQESLNKIKNSKKRLKSLSKVKLSTINKFLDSNTELVTNSNIDMQTLKSNRLEFINTENELKGILNKNLNKKNLKTQNFIDSNPKIAYNIQSKISNKQDFNNNKNLSGNKLDINFQTINSSNCAKISKLLNDEKLKYFESSELKKASLKKETLNKNSLNNFSNKRSSIQECIFKQEKSDYDIINLNKQIVKKQKDAIAQKLLEDSKLLNLKYLTKYDINLTYDDLIKLVDNQDLLKKIYGNSSHLIGKVLSFSNLLSKLDKFEEDGNSLFGNYYLKYKNTK